MQISDILAELERVKARFGDVEVRAGSAPITRIAVLPYAAIEANDNAQQPNMDQFVALLSRIDDRSGGPTWP